MTVDEANAICRVACQFGVEEWRSAPLITAELQAAWLLCTQPDVMFDLLELRGMTSEPLGDSESVALGEGLGEVYAEMLMATDWHMTPDRPEPGCEHVGGANAIRKIVPVLQ
jgi:hypothetical protein